MSSPTLEFFGEIADHLNQISDPGKDYYMGSLASLESIRLMIEEGEYEDAKRRLINVGSLAALYWARIHYD